MIQQMIQSAASKKNPLDMREIYPMAYHKNAKHIITPEIHNAIFQLYSQDTQPLKADFERFSKRYSIPRWKITRYAMTQGWSNQRYRIRRDWTEEELRILERNARYSPDTIRRKLEQAGYKRTYTSIQVKRKRMHYLQNLNGQSANSLAQCLGMTPNTVIRHIKAGRLKATKRGTERPDDMWHIKDSSIRKFIINNVDDIDLRKVDKYWFIDLLTNNLANL